MFIRYTSSDGSEYICNLSAVSKIQVVYPDGANGRRVYALWFSPQDIQLVDLDPANPVMQQLDSLYANAVQV